MIKNNVLNILKELPENVLLVAASKKRSYIEIQEAIKAGVTIIGENYCKEARSVFERIGRAVKWHYIGIPAKEKHDLLRRKSLEIFDMIETIDSFEFAKEIDSQCGKIGKIMEVLVEVNSGKEAQKSGVLPDHAVELIEKLSILKNIRVMGLMTMGPGFKAAEESRPYFKETKRVFEEIKQMSIPGIEMKYLSMGMSNSYMVAIDEGSNMVRIGTKIYENS